MVYVHTGTVLILPESIGFFIYLSPLIFIYTQCMFSVLMDDAIWSMQVLKSEEVVIEKVPKAIAGHNSHGNTEISFAFMHCVVCKFEK